MMGDVGRVKKLNDVLVQVNGHQWRLRVPENNTGTGHKFTLCAIQKDNKERWIRDWIEHYRKIGVDRVILYDNNSKNLPDVNAIVIPCPYKFGLGKYVRLYGPPTWTISFLHASLLTICGYKYRSGQLLNFDIDELLWVESLEKYSKRKLVYFDSYFVETKTDDKLPEDYSFRHFVYRNVRLRNGAHKYMARMDALLYCQNPLRSIKRSTTQIKGKFRPQMAYADVKNGLSRRGCFLSLQRNQHRLEMGQIRFR